MDSMRSLNTSLPSSTNPPTRPQVERPSEQLLQAFKSAALSVTHLYKQSAVDQSSARQAGYQDALDDLLGFLDKENLGLDDGEGWKVRQWATERFEKANYGNNIPESDDDRAERDGGRSGSPTTSTGQADATTTPRAPSRSSSPPVAEQPSTNASSDHLSTDVNEKQPVFTFRATPQPALDTDMSNSEMSGQFLTTSESSSSPSIRLEVINRANRTSNRQTVHPRHTNRSATNREVGHLAGTKRKLPLSEFFDISNFGNWKDASSGGKRGRFA